MRRPPIRTPKPSCPVRPRSRSGTAIGSLPQTVQRELSGLLERTGADELMLTALVYDIEDRIRSMS